MGFRLGAAWRRLDRLFNRVYQPLGLSHAHAQLLLCVLERKETRMADIVTLTGLTQPTISRLAAYLSKHRYIRRKKDPNDARSSLLSPAKRAITLRSELVRLQAVVDQMVHRNLAAPDIEELRRMLDLMVPYVQ